MKKWLFYEICIYAFASQIANQAVEKFNKNVANLLAVNFFISGICLSLFDISMLHAFSAAANRPFVIHVFDKAPFGLVASFYSGHTAIFP